MANMLKLPTEVLRMIAKETSQQRDLANLARVNKQLHQALNPVLYSIDFKFYVFYAARWVAINGSLDTLKVATSLGLDLHYHGQRRGTEPLLTLAYNNGHREIFGWLLDWGAPLDHQIIREPFGCMAIRNGSALNATLDAGDEDTALLLLSRGASHYFIHVGPEDDEGKIPNASFTSALHHAARQNMLRVVEFLVREKGLPIDLRNSYGYPPLFHLLLGRLDRSHFLHDNDTMVKKLIELGADVNVEFHGRLPLAFALEEDKHNHVVALLDAGAKVRPSHPHDFVRYPIHACIYASQSQTEPNPDSERHPTSRYMLQRLVEAGADIEERYSQGETPLGEAVMNGTPECVSALLDMGANANAPETDGMDLLRLTALHDKTPRTLMEKAVLLLKHGKRMDSPNTIEADSFLEWAMMYTQCEQRPGTGITIEPLLNVATSSTLDRDHLDDLLDRYIGFSQYHKPCVTLVRHGAALRDIDRATNASPTFYSAVSDEFYRTKIQSGFTKLFRWIIASRTPLAEAAICCNHDAARVLLDHGANPFFPLNRPVCPSGGKIQVWEAPGASAFEIAIQENRDFKMVKDMWRRAPHGSHPQLDAFIRCIPNQDGRTARWLRKVNGGKDDQGQG
ncbi:ankyrin repeat-containing domain protein [Hypoxylon crocopeplum]|nr:ankyrin repeat-containing domain protein [Hypoxylon crocopeplum]